MTDAANELLTPTEAAVVADVSVRNINRVFDEGILPKRFIRLKGGRWLKSEGCAFVSFYFHTAPRLTADERSRAIRALAGPKLGARDRPTIYGDDILTVNFGRFIEKTQARHESLRRAKEAVVEDPEILGGTPVLRGTRVPVHDIAASVRAGMSVDRLKSAYSGLDENKIELAKIYADANPQRGRPRTVGELNPDMKLLSEHRVARRRRNEIPD